MLAYHVFLSAMFTSFTSFVKFHVVGHFVGCADAFIAVSGN